MWLTQFFNVSDKKFKKLFRLLQPQTTTVSAEESQVLFPEEETSDVEEDVQDASANELHKTELLELLPLHNYAQISHFEKLLHIDDDFGIRDAAFVSHPVFLQN